jgi:hypothetical protein
LASDATRTNLAFIGFVLPVNCEFRASFSRFAEIYNKEGIEKREEDSQVVIEYLHGSSLAGFEGKKNIRSTMSVEAA